MCPKLRGMSDPSDPRTPHSNRLGDWLGQLPARYGVALVARPWRFVLAALAVTALVAAGLSRLEFSSDNRSFFGANNSDVALLQEMAPKVQEVLREIIAAEGIGLLLQRSSVIHADAGYSVTAKVTDKLNQSAAE